ncbi:MAG: hypothetical protein LBU72_01035 [Burkholderiaceae bacterium]|jgi:hypothetical protein|nr:hypothetical protein [Burkholderiaceae bacterium]
MLSKQNGRIRTALALLTALAAIAAAAPALAARYKDPASGCAVAAPTYLGNSDYTLQYHGGCKAGLAEGKGKATWILRNAPQNQVVWEGTFSAGVYLPPPAGIVSAREWIGPNSRDTVIFDLGALPAQSGIPAARLKVEATSDLTHYPDPCAPRTVWVTNAPAAAITADSAAQALLTAAVAKLKAHCGAQLDEQKKRQGSPGGPNYLQVRVVSTPDLESDRYGNPGPEIARAFVPLSPGEAIEGYSNQAASQQRQQQQKTQDQAERQTNAQRLRAFFKAHQAQGWADLEDIARNPFRYSGRVVVTAVQLSKVISPTRATVYAEDDDGWVRAYAVVDGQAVAQWQPGARLLAVRVIGRIKDDNFWRDEAAQLQLVGSQACKERGCTDWLRLPARLQDGQTP